MAAGRVDGLIRTLPQRAAVERATVHVRLNPGQATCGSDSARDPACWIPAAELRLRVLSRSSGPGWSEREHHRLAGWSCV